MSPFGNLLDNWGSWVLATTLSFSRTYAVPFLGTSDRNKVKLYYLVQLAQSHTFFARIGYWDFNRKPELPKRLSCLWVIGWVSDLQGLLNHGQEELELVYGHLHGLQPGPRSVYVKLLCHTPPRSRGLWCWSHSSFRGTLSIGGWKIFVLEVGTKTSLMLPCC